MLGFLFGTLCLIGLFKLARGGFGGCGGYRGWGHRHHGGFRRGGWMLRGLFERLETTPGQEKVILEAIDEVKSAASKVREEAEGARREVAESLKGAHFDQEKVRDLFARFDVKTEDVKKAAMAGLGKIHEALDEKQRAELAELLASFGRWGGGGGWSRRTSYGHI
jgi:Spy/CpxP family protein refolding chaperone